jgi:transcriptional regulator with PAS, ATPase and Fis domain
MQPRDATGPIVDERTTADHEPLPNATGPSVVSVTFFHPDGVQFAEMADRRSITVGRTPPADVIIDAPSLSRSHARFSREGNEVFVEDLESRNGTFVRNEPVRRARVRPGEAVTLGTVVAIIQNTGCRERTHLVQDRDDGCADAIRPTRLESNAPDNDFITESERMQALRRVAERVARADVTVLITGETGTGKEVLAATIHGESPRRTRPFRAVNCGAIVESLLPALLFGHERGAFTGAVRQSHGLFEEANGGTLFLDEIGELSLKMQAAILRAIETKRVLRVGAQREIQLDTRIIAATHRDLEEMVEQGSFRSDLFFRLNTVALCVPPLRERREDIEPLASYFLRASKQRFGGSVGSLDPSVVETLKRYAWPGNVRELRNVIERAVLLSTGAQVTLEDLPPKIRATESGSEVEPRAIAPAAEALDLVPRREVKKESARRDSFRDRMQLVELGLIAEALEAAGGNRSRAAELLNMPLRTLVHKIRSYGIGKTK